MPPPPPPPSPIATRVAFVAEPNGTAAGSPLTPPLQVEILDGAGARMGTATDPVSITLAAESGNAQLAGTTTRNASAGVATFNDLVIAKGGDSLTLVATSGSLRSDTSRAFDILPTFKGVQISAGADHTCVLNHEGAAFCWGRNDTGQLGVGDLTTTLGPRPVAGEKTFRSVSAGFVHSCGTTLTSEVYCWGEGAGGQLGDSTFTNRPSPTRVSSTAFWATVTVANQHACAIGTGASCWGAFNSFGELGDDIPQPQPVPRPVAGGLPFVFASARAQHTCAFVSDGTGYCWGSNLRGELGDGTTTHRSRPVAIAGGLAFRLLASGAQHTCGLTTTGVAYCWGSNRGGQLGDGSTQDRLTPVPVALNERFSRITAGFDHTCAIVEGAGQTYCWGANGFGQLGRVTTSFDPTPRPVAGGKQFVEISAGFGHTCAVTPIGAIYCWGNNTDGQIGDGTTTHRRRPALVTN